MPLFGDILTVPAPSRTEQIAVSVIGACITVVGAALVVSGVHLIVTSLSATAASDLVFGWRVLMIGFVIVLAGLINVVPLWKLVPYRRPRSSILVSIFLVWLSSELWLPIIV